MSRHKFILTAKSKDWRVLRVRCKCMAAYYPNRPTIRFEARPYRDNYYNYDYLAEVATIPEAIAAYRAHLVDVIRQKLKHAEDVQRKLEEAQKKKVEGGASCPVVEDHP